MLNERFCSICEEYIRFNNEFSRHLIFCDYAHEKKSLHFIFYDTYLKEIEIENLRRHVEDEKNENKVLRLFMNDLRTLKKDIQYTTKIITIDNIQKYNRIYGGNSKLNGISFKNDVSHIIQLTRFQLQFTISFLIVKKYNQDARAELFKENVSRTKSNIH